MSEIHGAEGISDEDLRAGLGVIRFLSESIGPRPPCSEQEERAAEQVDGELRRIGLRPELEGFRSARSFGGAYLAIFGLALGGSLLQGMRSRRRVGTALGLAGVLTAVAEGRFPCRGPLNLLRRRSSRNLHAVIEPKGNAVRTVCLMSHLDSSRSGLMFHPRVTPFLGKLVAATGAATLLSVISGPLRQIPVLRWLDRIGRGFLLTAGLLVLERELRGVDVPGANDNASGVGACLALGHGLARHRPANTRIVLLFTGSEESGPLGIRDFLHRHDTDGWLFVNFDGVGADAPLRVLDREGGPLNSVRADRELLELAAAVGREHPALAAAPLSHGSGLPYDSTPVLAGGGRAVSVVNQDGPIPNYHWPSDRFENISAPAFERAVRFGIELIRMIDEGD
ncbi:MAG: M28 family metallopeptidase [Solirubrobacterales bacterium]|nr:M28 family metallopeptidase [Solirubrobacterales bacterium]